MRGKLHLVVLTVCGMALVAGTAWGQTTTRSTATNKFEVISVVGNQLVVRGPDGTKEYTVPEDFRFTVDGKQLSVHELKVGMAGTATVTTLTTNHTVQVADERNVKIMKANGNSVIVRSADGKFKLFTSEDAVKYKVSIVRGGKPIEFQQMHDGDTVTATFITDKIVTLTQQEVDAQLAAAPAAPAARPAAASAPAAASPKPAAAKPAPAPAAAAPTMAPAAPKALPKTASSLPLLGLVGGLLVLTGAALTFARRRRSA